MLKERGLMNLQRQSRMGRTFQYFGVGDGLVICTSQVKI